MSELNFYEVELEGGVTLKHYSWEHCDDAICLERDSPDGYSLDLDIEINKTQAEAMIKLLVKAFNFKEL